MVLAYIASRRLDFLTKSATGQSIEYRNISEKIDIWCNRKLRKNILHGYRETKVLCNDFLINNPVFHVFKEVPNETDTF